MPDYEVFDLGDVVLQRGATLRNAKLAYKTYGSLSPGRNNVIVYPTSYGSQHTLNEGKIGVGRALDPRKYFIVVPNMFGNGLSSSPSNTPSPYDRARFPAVTLYDNITCQHRLLTEQFGIETIALVTGWSMGASRLTTGAACFPKWWSEFFPSADRPGPPITILCSWKASKRP